MIRRTMTLTLASALLVVSACGRADSDPAAGGLTVGETEALERAAARLDSRTSSPTGAESEALEDEIRTQLDAEIAKKASNNN